MDWYYVRGQERVGPLDDDAFQQCILEGTVAAATLVWNSTLSDWRPYGQVAGVASMAEAVAEASILRVACVECGDVYPVTEVLTYGGASVCARCKSAYFQRLLQGTPRSAGVEYGGFWRRFSAKVIDYALLGTAFIPVQTLVMLTSTVDQTLYVALTMVMGLVAFVCQVYYETYFIGSRGATPGKMALGLRVVVADGSKVSYSRAFGRAFAVMVSKVVFYGGFIMAAFDPERRALHDHMCNTRVIRP